MKDLLDIIRTTKRQNSMLCVLPGHATMKKLEKCVVKQVSKNPVLSGDGYAPCVWECPACREAYDYHNDGDNFNFCPECGQAINWEDKENDND